MSLFPLVKWSHSVPGVEMYEAVSADHGSFCLAYKDVEIIHVSGMCTTLRF